MIAPEDVLLEAMGAALRYGNVAWLRRQMCARLRESILVEVNHPILPYASPVVRDDGQV